MHRIDTPTAQKDKFGAGKNGFARGNPQTGTPSTDLDDDYFDSLQEEIVGVIEAAAITLDKSDRGQLLKAMKKHFQTSDKTLTALAGLPTGANKLPYFTGEETAGQTVLTQVGRDIIGMATVAAVLEYLQLGETVTAAKGALQKVQNLADVGDITAARLNLGLASAATRNVGNGINQIPDMSYFADGNGWFKLPSGKIFQYGNVLNSNTAHNFPIPFPRGNVPTIVGTAVSISAYQPVGNTEGIVYPNVISGSQFYMRSGTTASSSVLISWFAIGE